MAIGGNVITTDSNLELDPAEAHCGVERLGAGVRLPKETSLSGDTELNRYGVKRIAFWAEEGVISRICRAPKGQPYQASSKPVFLK
jgi:hypothetical protein